MIPTLVCGAAIGIGLKIFLDEITSYCFWPAMIGAALALFGAVCTLLL